MLKDRIIYSQVFEQARVAKQANLLRQYFIINYLNQWWIRKKSFYEKKTALIKYLALVWTSE